MSVNTVDFNKSTTMELSFVVSIFLAFVIFKAVVKSPKLSQTTDKQCELQREPNKVSNGSINPCTYEFLLDSSKVHENMKIQSDLLGSMGDVLDEVFTQHLDQSIILDISNGTKLAFTFDGEVIAAGSDGNGLRSVDGSIDSNNGNFGDMKNCGIDGTIDIASSPTVPLNKLSDVVHCLKVDGAPLSIAGSELAPRMNSEKVKSRISKLLSNNRISFLKMFFVCCLIHKYIACRYRRDKSRKDCMCLISHHGARGTRTVTYSTPLIHSQSQHANIINGNNIDTMGDINGISTSQTVDGIDGEISVTNTTKLNISGITGISNDTSELDIGSADDSGIDAKVHDWNQMLILKIHINKMDNLKP